MHGVMRYAADAVGKTRQGGLHVTEVVPAFEIIVEEAVLEELDAPRDGLITDAF